MLKFLATRLFKGALCLFKKLESSLLRVRLNTLSKLILGSSIY